MIYTIKESIFVGSNKLLDAGVKGLENIPAVMRSSVSDITIRSTMRAIKVGKVARKEHKVRKGS